MMTTHDLGSHANHEFLAACTEISGLLDSLVAHRDEHFGADSEAERTWAEVSSVREIARQLRATLAFVEGRDH
jgi:hypothetical protein